MIEQLKKYIYENNLIDKAISSFWGAFNNYKKENPVDYEKKIGKVKREEIEVVLHGIGLRSSAWPDCNYSHVTLTSFIFIKDMQIGTYTVWFSLDDESNDDDFLEI